MNSELDQTTRPDAKHMVRFYHGEEFLVAELAKFAVSALQSGDAFISIAKPSHTEALQAALRERGIDPDAAAGGRWVQLDCARTLETISRNGEPDAAAFAEVIEAPLRAMCKHHRRMRMFGEMVAMQCEAGDYAGAIKLESFVNELIEKLPVTVLCAYPMASFSDPRTVTDFARICDAHDHRLPAQPNGSSQESGHAGLVMVLQQHAAALEEEIRRRMKLENQLKQRERELCEQVEVLEALALAGTALIGEHDPAALICTIVDNAVRLTDASFGGFAQMTARDEDGAPDRIMLSSGDRAHFGDMSMGAIAELFQPIFDGDRVAHRSDLLQGPESVRTSPSLRSFIAVPVTTHTGAMHGALFMGHPEPGAFDSRDELTLIGIASHATLAIENAQLLETNRLWRRDLQRAVAQRTEELRHTELRLETLLAGITDYAIMLLDAEGRILTWNTGGERIFGYKVEEVLGSHFSRFYTHAEHDEDAPRRALRIAIERGSHEAEAWRTRKNGTRFWASAMLMPIRDDSGRVTGYAKVIRDLTDEKITEERLQQAQRMEIVGQLTGGIAHDFNNLLTIILGNIDEVLRLHPNEPEIRVAAERVSNAAERAATLTRQLLAFSRRQALNPKPVNVTMLLAGISDMLQRTLGEHVRIRTTYAGNWQCEVDAHQLESAILNLGINARDAMPEGGSLTLEVSNARFDNELVGDDHISGDYVVIEVSDTGSGMPAEVLERACEPFFTTKPLGHGTGLGLSQVYGFVRQSGGQFTLASEPGKGTTIRIFLPRAHETKDDEEPDAMATALPRGHETILVVEDEVGVRQYCAEQLRELGYTVLEACDGATALNALDEHPEIALLLTDVGLPVMNGGELVKRAQATRLVRAVRVRLSGRRDAAAQPVAAQYGTDAEALHADTARATRARAARCATGTRRARVRARAAAGGRSSATPDGRRVAARVRSDAKETGSLAEARAVIANGPPPDLAIVDMNLGGENGMEAIRDLRAANPKLPVIITSGYSDPVQRCDAADDDGRTVILPKPYSLRALKRTVVSLGFALITNADIVEQRSRLVCRS